MAFTGQTTTKISLPHNKNTELALVSLLLRHKDNFLKSANISKEDFIDDDSSKIYEAISLLYKDNKYVDINTVSDKSGITLEKLQAILEIKTHSDNIEDYISGLKVKTIERKLLDAHTKIGEVVYKTDLSNDDKVAQCLSALNSLSYNLEDKTIGLQDGYDSFITDLKQRVADKGKSVISWGFDNLDNSLGGIPTGLHIVGANPGMGKTSFADQLADHNALKGFKGLFFSAEMNYNELLFRKIQRELNIAVNRLRKGDLCDRELEKVIAFKDQLSKNLYINDVSNLDVNRLKSIAHLQKAKYGLDFIVIDYLQLLSVKLGGKSNKYEEVTEISKQLKSLSKDLKIPVIALAQLNRNNQSRESKQPILSDLRDSGSIEQDADSIIFIHRDDYFDKNSQRKGKADIIIAKNRYGETATHTLKWIPTLTKFEEDITAFRNPANDMEGFSGFDGEIEEEVAVKPRGFKRNNK